MAVLTDRYCTLFVSKDGANDFIAPTVHSLGEVGAFQTRVIRTRIGQARHMVFRIEVSSPHRRDLLAASMTSDKES